MECVPATFRWVPPSVQPLLKRFRFFAYNTFVFATPYRNPSAGSSWFNYTNKFGCAIVCCLHPVAEEFMAEILNVVPP